jgi:hypothetical protein
MSRIITYPSVVEPTPNTIVVVDATVAEVENLVLFCQSCDEDYDIYLYSDDVDDLQWLNSVVSSATHTLVSQTSSVTINNSDQISYFGSDQKLNTPLAYFKQVDIII